MSAATSPSGVTGGLAGRGDEVYEALLDAHAGLDDAASLALNSRLVLLLADAVGDADRVIAAVRAARQSLGASR